MILDPLLRYHPSWTKVKNILLNGVQCDFDPLSEEDRKKDLQLAIERGNHKSASSNPNLLHELVQDDISHGFQIPLPLEAATRVAGGVLAPCGIASQFSINEFGERIEKDRLTHDLSFDYAEGKSLNKRLVRDNLPDLRYGPCLSQLIHYIHALRFNHPDKIIVASKIDLK